MRAAELACTLNWLSKNFGIKVANPAKRIPSVAPAIDKAINVGFVARILVAFGRSFNFPNPGFPPALDELDS